MWLIGVATLLVGCNWTFSLEYVDAAIDTRTIDASTCSMPPVSDTFDGTAGGGCVAWAYPFPQGTIPPLDNGDLVLMPELSKKNDVGCLSQVTFPFGPSGIFMEVDAYGTGLEQYNTLLMWWDGDLTIPTTLQIANGNISFADRFGVDNKTTHYDLIAMRWVRIRPSDDRTAVIADTSPDGRIWKTLGTELRTPPDTLRVQIQSGTNGATTATALRLASFDVCP